MKWTDEDKAKLKAMAEAGVAWRIIGAHLGRSGEAAFNKAKLMGLGPKPFTGNQSPAWAAIVRVCQDGRPRTVHELCKATGNARITIDALMKKRKALGQAHVARWERRAGCPVPYWIPTPGVSARKPKPLSQNDREKARIERMKADDPLRYKAYLERKRLRTALRRGVTTPQHEVVRALFGMGAQV